MVSNCNNNNKRVTIFIICSFLLAFAHISQTNDEFIIKAFDASPRLKSLSNVHVWLDDKVTCLSEILGPDAAVWEIGRDDAKQISRILFAALACNYSKIVVQIIQSGEYVAHTCNGTLENQSAHLCRGQLKRFFNGYRDTVVGILCSTLYYAENLKVRNKKFLIAVLGVHMFFNRDKSFESSSEGADGCLQCLRITSYLRLSLESYTTEFCTPPTFGIANSPLEEVCVATGENGLEDLVGCVNDFLETSIWVEALHPSSLGHDEKYYKRHSFAIDNLTMSELVETELIQGNRCSAVKHLSIDFQGKDVSLDTVRAHVVNGYRPENIVKYRALVIESLGSIVFHLMSKIIKLSVHFEGTTEAQRVNEYIVKAVTTLESLRSNSVLGWSVNQIKLKQMIRNDRRDVTEAINGFYSVSNFEEKSVGKLFQTMRLAVASSAKLDEFIEILDRFIKSIDKIKPFIFAATEIMNEPISIVEQCEFRFIESNDLPDRRSPIVAKSCEFALFLTKHFVLSNALVSQCKDLATQMINGDYTKIVDCFSKVNGYGKKSIETIFKEFYEQFINSVSNPDDSHLAGVYYSLFEAMYSLLLYLNNSDVYDVTKKTEDPTVGLEYIQLKADSAIRFHRTISNPLRVYINQFCSVPEESLAISSCGKNLPLTTFDYIVEQMKTNYKKYTGDDYRDDRFDVVIEIKNECEEVDYDFSVIVEIEDGSEEVDDDDDDHLNLRQDQWHDAAESQDNDSSYYSFSDDSQEFQVDDEDDSLSDDTLSDNSLSDDSLDDDSLNDDSFVDDSDEYELDVLRRFARTVREHLDLRRFLFEDVIFNDNPLGYSCSFVDDVKVAWDDGGYMPVRDIFDVVKGQTHPRHVRACMLIMPRIIFFLLSEMLKDVVEIIKNSDIESVNDVHASSITESLKTVFTFEHYFLFLYNYYTVFKYYLKRFSRRKIDTESCDRLIDLIETKQAEFGVRLQNPNMYKTIITNDTSNNTTNTKYADNSLAKSVEKLNAFAGNATRVFKKLFYHSVTNTWKNFNDLTIM